MRRIIRWSAIALVIVGVAAYGLVSFMIASGVTKAERKPQDDHPSSFGLNFEDVEFPSRKWDANLRGWYISESQKSPTIIFVHGISSNRSGDQAVELAAKLTERGFSALLFDLRAHGDSDGDRISGGYFEQQDVLGAFDYLSGRGVPSDRIGLIGFSMGAGTGILAAAEEPAIGALVADSPYANASDLIAQETARKTVFPEWIAPVFIPGARLLTRSIYGINISALTPEKAVSRLSYPILVIHGEADTRIPVEHGRRVYQAANSGSLIWLVPEVDHVDAFMDHPDEYVERVAAYFESRFGD